MRVFPVNNYSVSTNLKKGSRLEKPTVETVQNNDSVSFKANYESVFRDGLRTEINSTRKFRNLFANLMESVQNVPGCLIAKEFIPTDFDVAFNFFRREINDPLDNIVLFKTKSGNPLMVATNTSLNFYSPDSNYDPNALESFCGDVIRFSKEDDDYCLSRPLHEIILWSSSGKLKEDIRYISHDGGIASHTYYKKDGSEDGWKNFFFGT